MINERYFGDELTVYGFISHMESFMKRLLTDPKSAKVDDYLESHGIDNERAIKMLLKRRDKDDEESSVLIRKEKIKTGDDGKDIFCISYKIPRKDYKKKMRRLFVSEILGNELNEELNYNEMLLSSTPNPFRSGEKVISQCPPGTTGDRFAGYVNNNSKNYTPKMFTDEEQMVKDIEEMDTDGAYKNRGGLNKPIVKETDCAGCLQGGGENPEAGEVFLPMGKTITRKLPETRVKNVFMTEDQIKHLKKVMSEATAGTSEVTPASELAWPAFGDAETENHKNICADPELMKGGVAAGKKVNK